MTHDVIFDSAKFPSGKMIGLACGYVSLTQIDFVNEKIKITVEAKNGNVEFRDAEMAKLLCCKVQVPDSGDEKFSDLMCIVTDGVIKLGFPQYSYVDNYPNCDGESDRWTKTVSGFNYLCYDIKNNRIIE